MMSWTGLHKLADVIFGITQRHIYKWCLKFEQKVTNIKNKVFAALLTDLYKAFVRLGDDLLIANFHANGIDLVSRA